MTNAHRRALAITIAAGVLGAVPAAAQNQDQQAPASPDPWENITFGATLEAFYEYNWNDPIGRINLLRAYDTRANVLGIQQVAVVVDLTPDVENDRRYGLRVDFQYGQATETVQGGAANEPRPDVYRHIWQAFGSYVFPVGNGLQTDFGKFASNLGFETNYAKDNNNFTRAYLFNFLPFYHSGLRVTYPASDKVTLMYMLTNGIQQTEDFNDYKSNHFTAIVKPIPALTWTTSYYFGQEQQQPAEEDVGPDGFFTIFDSYASYTLNDRTSLGLDVNYVNNRVTDEDPKEDLLGIGAYGRYQATPAAALAVRYERVDDDGGLFGGIDQLLQEITVTGEYRFADGFLFRAELRHDWSNEPFFLSDTPDGLKEGQTTLLFGMVWWMGSKKGAW
jgi:Putative beta-barrel porin-2, OmpL-like. bbp2